MVTGLWCTHTHTPHIPTFTLAPYTLAPTLTMAPYILAPYTLAPYILAPYTHISPSIIFTNRTFRLLSQSGKKSVQHSYGFSLVLQCQYLMLDTPENGECHLE